MRLVTMKWENEEKLGLILGDIVSPLDQLGFSFLSMNELILNCSETQFAEMKKITKLTNYKKIDEVQLCAPIPIPLQDILCLGMNYEEHKDELARNNEDFKIEEKVPIYFSKRVNRAVGHFSEIDPHLDLTSTLDYECELGVIIKKDCKNIKREQIKDYIFGYTIINDVTARELQTKHKQWYYGKSLDDFTCMGPVIVTADEIDHDDLNLSCKVNDELRQFSNTNKMIFDVGEIIEELSKGMTLKAGTIIATGTPKGVGMGFTPPRYLKTGDKIECTIEKIGTLTNIVKQGDYHG